MSGTRDNSGSLSRNDRKEKETHPDFKGKATINGVDYWISGWTKENERGKWLSLSFTPREAQQPAQGGGGTRPAPPIDDEIPF
jgi:hypothetical protein